MIDESSWKQTGLVPYSEFEKMKRQNKKLIDFVYKLYVKDHKTVFNYNAEVRNEAEALLIYIKE